MNMVNNLAEHRSCLLRVLLFLFVSSLLFIKVAHHFCFRNFFLSIRASSLRFFYFCYVAFPRTVRLIALFSHPLSQPRLIASPLRPSRIATPRPPSSRNIFPPNVRVHVLRVQLAATDRTSARVVPRLAKSGFAPPHTSAIRGIAFAARDWHSRPWQPPTLSFRALN